MIHVGGPSPRVEAVVDTYKYKKITDDTSGTEAVVWTPASGKSIRIISMIVSVTGAGLVELKDSTAGNTIAVLAFNEKRAVPFNTGFEFPLPADHVLSAKFTSDSGTNDAHITALGIEE